MDWIQTKTILFRGFSPDARHLIGVSGGRDSVALLHHLVDVGYKKLIISHLNHELRGRSSNVDARFVEKLAAKYNLDLAMGSTDVRTLAKRNKISIETAARDARYKFFAKIAKQKRCRTIFLAHHADDLVETFLLNLFRGAGLTGLAAMHEVSIRQIDDVDLAVVRPLLGIWRDEIDKYVREHRLKFREDASNKNLAPLRNRLRQRIIPYIEKQLGRKVRMSIWRAATIAAEEEAWIDNETHGAISEGVDFSVEKLRTLPIVLQRRAIVKWLRARNVAEIGFDLIERVRALLDRDAPVAKTNLPQDRHVRRRAGKIFVE
jgi:tRNA(Ile)-lysidine synthase